MFAFSIWLAMAKKVMKKSAPKVKKDANQKQTKPVKEPKPFKKPASLPFDPPKEEGMSLEAKTELFQKRKGDDVGAFLKSQFKDQREALWQSKSDLLMPGLHEKAQKLMPSVQGAWQPGAQEAATFLKNGGLVGVPFNKMMRQYGLQELMRRIHNCLQEGT